MSDSHWDFASILKTAQHETTVKRAREGDELSSYFALRSFCEYVLERHEDPPGVLTEYAAECLNRATDVEDPSRGYAVAKALVLVGQRRGKSRRAEVAKLGRGYKYLDRFIAIGRSWGPYLDQGNAAEVVNSLLRETAEHFEVDPRTVKRNIEANMGKGWIKGLKQWLHDQSVEPE